ncbi:hypothetical protein V1227_06900 [Lentzea sp. DG1S-22]|uniref:hypothetical protein n=1 Tax=Lentzea sp. DG1S-22 TaxID=3108822 RepID=UPI002E798FE3|nr:hypothetical protein [Lentzea sp. DG1S-22]WVH82478.1 hypothetical protein V1227_06900 [Lentzea sp. DG1S-22]
MMEPWSLWMPLHRQRGQAAHALTSSALGVLEELAGTDDVCTSRARELRASLAELRIAERT